MTRTISLATIGGLFALAVASCSIGCSSSPPPLTEPPKLDPATARADYWLDKPSVASVFADNYDKLWETSAEVARRELFVLDRQDYRDGLLTTRPLVSKQIFEPWRPDTGTVFGVEQNSLQTIRRTIEFQFDRLPGGYIVTPKVIVERLAQRDPRITSSAQYSNIVATAEPGAIPTVGSGADSPPYWYAIGRDEAMETDLANSIKARLGS